MEERPALVVPAAHAERALRTLQKRGLLDPSRRIRQREAEVSIPVSDAERALQACATIGGARVEPERDAEPRIHRPTPHEKVVERLRDALPPDLLALVPDKWEKLGDLVVLRVPDALAPHARPLAEAFARALDARTVVEDPAGVTGELREMQGRILFGSDPETTHLENGIRYKLDASRVMFSSGNVHERKRAASIPARGETVVDMFAGIGYFALPLAVHAKPARVHAIEKNPVSFRYLQENARLNGVEDVVEPWLGDNRAFPREGIADRVLMGYFPRTEAFLPKAMGLLKPGGGILHYHNTAHAESWRDELTRQLFDAAMDAHRGCEILEARVVKTHSPGVVHAVMVASVGPRLA